MDPGRIQEDPGRIQDIPLDPVDPGYTPVMYILTNLWVGYKVEYREIYGNGFFFPGADVREGPHMEIETDLSLIREEVLAVCPQWS